MKKVLLLALALIVILPIALQAQYSFDNCDLSVSVSDTEDVFGRAEVTTEVTTLECRDGNGQLWRRLTTSSTMTMPDTTSFNQTFTTEDEVFYGNGQLESRETLFQQTCTSSSNRCNAVDFTVDFTQVLVRYYENGQLKFRGPSSPLTGHVESAGEQYTGGVETYYENGQLWVKGTMKLGDWDGPYESYYQSGEVSSNGMFTAGLLCGDWIAAGITGLVGYAPCPPGGN